MSEIADPRSSLFERIECIRNLCDSLGSAVVRLNSSWTVRETLPTLER